MEPNATGFLLSVMRHPKTPATLRIKMALATQPYIHPRKSNRPTSPVAAAGDRHGFEVEPALAKKLRNEIARPGQLKRRRNPRPEDQKTEQKQHQKIEAKIATLQCPCPSRYSVGGRCERQANACATVAKASITRQTDRARGYRTRAYKRALYGIRVGTRSAWADANSQRFGRSARPVAWQAARALARTNAPN